MKILAVLVILVMFPAAFADSGLFVSKYNITFSLAKSDFSVEETIVFGNAGTASTNLFRDNVYLSRGDASEVEVYITGKDFGYSVAYSPSTIININLMLWRGETKEVTIKYRRSDMLFREDRVYIFDGLAIGAYPWSIDRATVKFIAPEGFSFGNVTPYVAGTQEKGRKVLNYELAPTDIERFNAIRDGFPVRVEYAEYSEMTISEMKDARDFIVEAESDIGSANKSIENAKDRVYDITPALKLFLDAKVILEDSRANLEMAEIKSNQYSGEYNPYVAHYYASASRELARDASRKAGEAKDLANYEVQSALEEKILGTGSNIFEQPEDIKAPAPKTGGTTGPSTVTYAIAFILIAVAAMAVFGAYKLRPSTPQVPTVKTSKVEEFRAIRELKHKTFDGFDKKVDKIKQGTELAAEIRDLRKKKERLESAMEKLRRTKVAGEISDSTFQSEKEEIDRHIYDTVAGIDALQKRLKELKKAR